MEYVFWCLAGAVYGTIIGIMPVAGAATGLLSVFSLAPHFLANPYYGIVFMTGLIAASSTGDSYTSILTGIPGGAGTNASVFDGHPMAKNGEAARAIGISLLDSTVNGVIWGILAFAFIPIYGKIILYFGVPEFAALYLLSFFSIAFITSKNTVIAIISILLGLFIGMIGLDPYTSSPRLTFGWEYLNDGIQIMPMIAGLFAVPELLDGWKTRHLPITKINNYWQQIHQGFRDCWVYRRDVLRGGFIGFVTGMLPGAGGTIGDIMSYGITASKHPEEQFGNGNPRGLAGCEGANNAQKAASMLPTILFGIPTAPFAAIMLAMCVYFGMYMGSPELVNDRQFVWAVGGSFVGATIVTFILCLFLTKYIVKLLEIPYWIYMLSISGVIIWSCFQYTGTADDLYILALCALLGLVAKFFNFSRPAILLSYIVAVQFENYTQQTFTLYTVKELSSRPILLTIVALISIMLYFILTNKRKKNDTL